MRKILVLLCTVLFLVSFLASATLFGLQNTVVRQSFYTDDLTTAIYPQIITKVSRLLYEKNELVSRNFRFEDIRSVIESSYPIEKARAVLGDLFRHVADAPENSVSNRRFALDLTDFKTRFERNMKSFVLTYLKGLPACSKIEDAAEFDCLPIADLSDESIIVYLDSLIDLATLTKDIPDSFSFEYPAEISKVIQPIIIWQWYWIVAFAFLFVLIVIGLFWRRRKSLAKLSFFVWLLITIIWALILLGLNTIFSYLSYSILESNLKQAADYLMPILDFISQRLHAYFAIIGAISAGCCIVSAIIWVFLYFWNKRRYAKKRLS